MVTGPRTVEIIEADNIGDFSLNFRFMEHASSPSLISLELATDGSLERSSFRGGLAVSCLLHALVIVMAMFVRFHSDSEQPLRTMSVSLVSLPAILNTAPSPTPTPTKKSAVTPAPQTTAPPAPKPAPQPVEETLPPLPIETASERLSESLGGAINSIVVPQQRETSSPTVPAQESNIHPSEDSSPLIEDLRLPSAPPTIARPKRLQRIEPLKIPSKTAPPTSMSDQAQARSEPPSPPSLTPADRVPPVVKPAPAIPSLNEVTPFMRPEQERIPPKIGPSAKIEESLERSLPNIRTPLSTPNIPKRSRERSSTKLQPKSSRPKVLAPKLSKIPEPLKPQATTSPPKPKMSDTVKKLLEGLKSTALTPTPQKEPLKQTKPSLPTTPSIKPPPSAIDRRIAKLSIPEVTSVESIKQRLQLLEVESAEGPGSSASKPSEGKNRYLAMVEERIDRQWVAPPLLASNPLVVLKFHISRSGKVSEIRIAESSGHAHYDSAAQRAVQAVNPLPAFPADVSDSFFDVKYRFIKD